MDNVHDMLFACKVWQSTIQRIISMGFKSWRKEKETLCWRNEISKCELTPTWFEHATFWSGVRRATVAPRSRELSRVWQDSNLQSPDPKSGALSIRPHTLSQYCIRRCNHLHTCVSLSISSETYICMKLNIETPWLKWEVWSDEFILLHYSDFCPPNLNTTRNCFLRT